MKKILVPIGCRSDEGLSAPVIKRLCKHFEVETIHLVPQDFEASYSRMNEILKRHFDLVFITGDRVEMCAAAAAAFHNKILIAHFGAGVTNDPITTFDDVDRHCITLWSDIQFCEDGYSKAETEALLHSIKKSNSYVVGITHLDDLKVDESKVMKEPYDLLLINAEPLGITPNHIKERFAIQIGGNPDGGVSFIGDIVYPQVPRSQFFGLLNQCQRFITNSSAAIYEAPHFLKPEQIIMIGDRNKNRPIGPFKTGASDRIVKILQEFLK